MKLVIDRRYVCLVSSTESYSEVLAQANKLAKVLTGSTAVFDNSTTAATRLTIVVTNSTQQQVRSAWSKIKRASTDTLVIRDLYNTAKTHLIKRSKCGSYFMSQAIDGVRQYPFTRISKYRASETSHTTQAELTNMFGAL